MLGGAYLVHLSHYFDSSGTRPGLSCPTPPRCTLPLNLKPQDPGGAHMTDQRPPAEDGRIERARRLRRQIQRLKGEAPKDDAAAESGRNTSLREQVEERAAGQKGPGDKS